MEEMKTKEANIKAINRFKNFTTLKKSRRTLLKMFFSADQHILSPEDEEDIYFLYNLLEDLE